MDRETEARSLIPASEVDKTEYEHCSEQDNRQCADRQTFNRIITEQRAADTESFKVLCVCLWFRQSAPTESP